MTAGHRAGQVRNGAARLGNRAGQVRGRYCLTVGHGSGRGSVLSDCGLQEKTVGLLLYSVQVSGRHPISPLSAMVKGYVRVQGFGQGTEGQRSRQGG